MGVYCPVGIQHFGPSGSEVVGPQGTISGQTTHSHISGDSSRKNGTDCQDPDFDQQHAETLCMLHRGTWWPHVDVVMW